jgi:hypothetical protein
MQSPADSATLPQPFAGAARKDLLSSAFLAHERANSIPYIGNHGRAL